MISGLERKRGVFKKDEIVANVLGRSAPIIAGLSREADEAQLQSPHPQPVLTSPVMQVLSANGQCFLHGSASSSQFFNDVRNDVRILEVVR